MLLAVEGDVERGAAAIRNCLLPIPGVIRIVVELHLAPAVPEKPAPRVMRLIDRNPVDPCFQRALAAEVSNVAEHFEEDFLHHVARLGRVVEQPQGQGINRLLEAQQQILVGPLRARAQAFHEPQVFDVRAFHRSIRAQFEN